MASIGLLYKIIHNSAAQLLKHLGQHVELAQGQ